MYITEQVKRGKGGCSKCVDLVRKRLFYVSLLCLQLDSTYQLLQSALATNFLTHLRGNDTIPVLERSLQQSWRCGNANFMILQIFLPMLLTIQTVTLAAGSFMGKPLLFPVTITPLRLNSLFS